MTLILQKNFITFFKIVREFRIKGHLPYVRTCKCSIRREDMMWSICRGTGRPCYLNQLFPNEGVRNYRKLEDLSRQDLWSISVPFVFVAEFMATFLRFSHLVFFTITHCVNKIFDSLFSR